MECLRYCSKKWTLKDEWCTFSRILWWIFLEKCEYVEKCNQYLRICSNVNSFFSRAAILLNVSPFMSVLFPIRSPISFSSFSSSFSCNRMPRSDCSALVRVNFNFFKKICLDLIYASQKASKFNDVGISTAWRTLS